MIDLWIRTQDKSSLRKVNGVILLNLEWEERWALFLDTHEDVSKCMHLGTYKTKERALQVLDEIQALLSVRLAQPPIEGYTKYDFEKLKSFQPIVVTPNNPIVSDIGCVVYQMPDEEEE